MESIWNDADRSALAGRIGKLNPAAKAAWGKMSVGMMIDHLTRAFRMATGELAVKPKRSAMRFRPLAKFIIYYAPWPKGAPTAPELICTDDGDFGPRRAALKKAFDRFMAHPRNQLAEHPAFGKLNEKDWGRLVWRHIDHHLRQFGA